MLRVQLGVLFTVLVLFLTGAAYWTHQSVLDKTLDRDAALGLERAATIAEHERRLAEYSLMSKAEFIAAGADLNESIVAPYNDEEGNALPADKQAYERHLKVHERLNRYLKEFELYDKGLGNGVDNRDLPLRWRRPVQNDLYFAVDKNGIGLAALGKDLLKWHGDDVSKLYPLLSEVMVKNETRTAVMRWSYDPKAGDGDKLLYMVAMSPIRLKPQDPPVGVVVVGNLLNDGAAKYLSELATDTSAPELAPQVAYIYDNQVVASTLGTSAQALVNAGLLSGQKIMEQEGRYKTANFEMNGDSYLVKARYLFGYADAKPPVGVLVMTNLETFKKPLKAPGQNTLLAGALVLLIGLIGIMVFVQLFTKPLTDLEQGIQEIIAGNKDYAFQGKGHKVAQSLAHQLNLLSAFLQGKPMPDDEDGGSGGWGDISGRPQGGAPQGGAAPRVQGVSMSDLMKPATPKDDEPEA